MPIRRFSSWAPVSPPHPPLHLADWAVALGEGARRILSRVVLLFLTVVLSWGCTARADHVFTAPGRLITGSSGPQPGFTVKVVQAKHGPTEVFGDDGSLCRLTAARFARVEVGDWLACDWTITPEPRT